MAVAAFHGSERWGACVCLARDNFIKKAFADQGRRSSAEDYSYFTLRREKTNVHPATSLFGISCTRQLDSSQLIKRPAEVTRSTVQKAVVVISDSPQHFGAIKAQLGVVTAAWFAQKDFTDLDILQRFQESLPLLLKNQEGEMDHYFGISLREFIHEFKWQTLVLFKAALLQPKASPLPGVELSVETS